MTDAEKLKKIRKQLRLSQHEIADLVQVSQSAISSIEAGRNKIYWDLVLNMVNYAKVNPWFLLREEAPIFLSGKSETDALKKKVRAYEALIDKLNEARLK